MTEVSFGTPDRAALEVGIEDIEPDHWVAWLLPVPGCYASGRTEDDALAGVPDACRAETGRAGRRRGVTCRDRFAPSIGGEGFPPRMIPASSSTRLSRTTGGRSTQEKSTPGSPGSKGTTGGSGA